MAYIINACELATPCREGFETGKIIDKQHQWLNIADKTLIIVIDI